MQIRVIPSCRRYLAPCFIIVTLLLAGCAGPKPDIVSTEPLPGETVSREQTRQVLLDHPELLSGDYFRKRELAEVTPDSVISVEKMALDRQKQLEKRVVELEKKSAKADGSRTSGVPGPVCQAEGESAAGRVKVKIGLMVTASRSSSQTRDQLQDQWTATARNLIKTWPVVVITPAEISELVARSGCIDKSDLKCIGTELNIFPGARMLILVQNILSPKTFPGTAKVRLTIMDPWFGYHYIPKEVTVAVTTPADLKSFTSKILKEAFTDAVEKSQLMPWFCRPFKKEKNTWYVNAGSASGLKPGDILKVVTRGRVVKTPSGFPAGWIPGQQKGILEVKLLFSEDLSVCRIIDGQGPDWEDILLKEPD